MQVISSGTSKRTFFDDRKLQVGIYLFKRLITYSIMPRLVVHLLVCPSDQRYSRLPRADPTSRTSIKYWPTYLETPRFSLASCHWCMSYEKRKPSYFTHLQKLDLVTFHISSLKTFNILNFLLTMLHSISFFLYPSVHGHRTTPEWKKVRRIDLHISTGNRVRIYVRFMNFSPSFPLSWRPLSILAAVAKDPGIQKDSSDRIAF